MNHAATRLNALAQLNNAQSYLEIGVDRGNTLMDVSIPDKTAVDVKFRFDIQNEAAAGHLFFEMTSDLFFTREARHQKYDLLLIDGLHTFEQTLRDFTNSLSCAHDKTIWVIDDTVPCDVFSSLTNHLQAHRYRDEAGLTPKHGKAWHGDVFKLVFALHDFFPMFSYRTVLNPGNPQTVIWRQPRTPFKPLFNSLETISRLTYFDFKEQFDVLRVADDAQIRSEIAAAFQV